MLGERELVVEEVMLFPELGSGMVPLPLTLRFLGPKKQSVDVDFLHIVKMKENVCVYVSTLRYQRPASMLPSRYRRG